MDMYDVVKYMDKMRMSDEEFNEEEFKDFFNNYLKQYDLTVDASQLEAFDLYAILFNTMPGPLPEDDKYNYLAEVYSRLFALPYTRQ